MQTAKIAFIGAGNMASSIIGGLISKGTDPKKILSSDPSTERLQALRSLGPIAIGSDNNEAVRQADVIVLAVKPQILPDVAKQIAPAVREKNPLVISIAAGITCKSLQSWLGENTAVVRCMPNTPALIQAAATALYATDQVSAEQKDLADQILRAVGIVLWVNDEAQLDAVTAISGSGPAYFFLFMEAIENVAKELGLDEQTSRQLTLQTALGAAQMAIGSEDSLAVLRQQVTSPGGTTEAAITLFENEGLRETIRHALTRARDRSIELAAG